MTVSYMRKGELFGALFKYYPYGPKFGAGFIQLGQIVSNAIQVNLSFILN